MIQTELDKPLSYDEFRVLAADAKRSGRTLFDEMQLRMKSSQASAKTLVERMRDGENLEKISVRDQRTMDDKNASGLALRLVKKRNGVK